MKDLELTLRAAPLQDDRPTWPLVAALACFAAIWLALLAATSLVPPADNIEQLTWVHSLEWGYYKHPPLPTWLFWLPAMLFGLSEWTSYVAGAVVTVGSMIVLWQLLKALRGHTYATIALGAVLCVTYYNGRLYYYNHNVVLMLCSTAAAALCWKALESQKLRWWAALGLAIGLGALAKYQIAITVACVFAVWLQQRGWTVPAHRLGALLAALVALCVVAPHIEWLRANEFAPIDYALESSLGANLPVDARLQKSSLWLVDQLANRALPALLLLGAAAALSGARARKPQGEVPETSTGAGRAVLLAWGLVPLLFMFLVGLAGAEMQLQWGTPFLLFVVPAAMELSAPWMDWSRVLLRPAAKVFCGIQALLLAVNFSTSPIGPSAMRDDHWRTLDARALARAVEGPALQALAGRRICVISGPAPLAGALALHLSDHPLVLIDGRYDRSPWVHAQTSGGCGVLEVRDTPTTAPHGSLPFAWRVRALPH